MATAECVIVALLPDPSAIVPPLSARASAAMASPSASLSPDTMVYVKTKELVPPPDENVANLLVSPLNGIRGFPVTTTASDIVTVT